MKVIDFKNWAWFLFEHEGKMYLDAHCNMSAFGYTYMIQLNEEELKSYKVGGREYLSKLAHDINYTVPIAKNTTSIYKGRDVSRQFSQLASDAIETWRTGSSAKNT